MPENCQATGSDGAKNVCADEIALRSTNDRAQLGKRSGRMCSLRRISRLAFGRQKITCCCERKMCGSVHKDDFVVDSRQWAWTESPQLNEKRILRRKAVLGLDDYKGDEDDVKTGAMPSHQSEEIEIRKDKICRVCSGVVAAIRAQLYSRDFAFLSGASSPYRRICF